MADIRRKSAEFRHFPGAEVAVPDGPVSAVVRRCGVARRVICRWRQGLAAVKPRIVEAEITYLRAKARGISTRRFDQRLSIRRRNEALIREGLAAAPIDFLEPAAGAEAAPYQCTMLLRPEMANLRPAILAAAQAEGVPLGVDYGDPLYTIDHLKDFAKGCSFPTTEALVPRILTLDPAPYNSATQMRAYVRGLRKVFAALEELASHRDLYGCEKYGSSAAQALAPLQSTSNS